MSFKLLKTSLNPFGLKIITSVIFVNFLMLLLGGLFLYKSYTQYEEKANINAQNLLEILEKSITNNFEKIDLLLITASNEIKNSTNSPQLISIETFLNFEEMSVIDFNSLTIVDDKAKIIYNKNFSPFSANLDKNIFIDNLFSKPIDEQLHISKPVQNKNNEWFLLFARQINLKEEDGEHRAIIYITYPVNSFYKIFNTLQTRHGGIVIRDKDLITVVKFPKDFKQVGEIGDKKITDNFKLKLKEGKKSGLYFSESNSYKKMVVYKEMNSYPFYINLGLASMDYLEDWNKEFNEITIGLTLLMILTSIGTYIIYKSWNNLSIKDQNFNLILNSAGEAIYGVNNKGICTFCNLSAIRMLGYERKEELLGRELQEILYQNEKNKEDQTQLKIYTSIIFGEIAHHDDEKFKRKDNSVFPVEYWSYPQYQDGKLVGAVITFLDITKKKAIADMVWKQAHYDSLTSLPNRKYFKDKLNMELENAKNKNQHLALLFIDLDNFKDINDSLGHQSGDILLEEAAIRLMSCVKTSDTISRLGGDEFTIILPNVLKQEDIDKVTQKIIRELGKPFDLKGNSVQISASIGITTYPLDGQTTEILLKNADQAMYVAKEQGRNCSYQFHQELNNKLHKRMEISNDLRKALNQDQFELYIQPILDMKTKKIIKGEILLRWYHPLKGFVSPMEFIPIAEEMGMINELGDWIFKKTVSILTQWHNEKKISIGFQLAINVSPIQFAVPDLVTKWLSYIEEKGLPTHYLVLEITEGLLLDDKSEISKKIIAFRNAGLQMAIDDFGTGYSALSYLYKYNIDYIKIDKSFIHNIMIDKKHTTITEAMIVMAHTLGIKVVAEGIEFKEQEAILETSKCDFAQGFMYHKPMPIKDFEKIALKN